MIDIYARVSKLRDKDQTSTPAQVASCRAVLTERGLQVGKVHVDDGKSAWDPRVYRPGWQELMARLEKGEAGGVIVYDLERFARLLKDGERLVTAAERGLLVLDSEGEYDLRKPGDKKNFRNAIVAAEYYSDLLKSRVRRGKRAKAESGAVDMRRSFGFEQDGVTLVEAEAEVIRKMAKRLLAGETQDSLIRELNARPVPSVHGAPWGRNTFRQVMTRPRNAGHIVHNGAVMPGVRLPGEPILPQLTHERLVALYASRKPGGQPSGRYLLTGFADCGACGADLGGRPASGTRRAAQYWCRTCRHTFADTRRLEDWAGDFAIRTLSDPQHADAIAAVERELESKRSRIAADAADVEAAMSAMAAKHRADLARLAPARHASAIRDYDAIRDTQIAHLEALDAELANLKAQVPEPVPPGQRTLKQADPEGYRQVSFLADWTDGTDADRRAMLARALQGRRIIVGPGRPACFDSSRLTIV